MATSFSPLYLAKNLQSYFVIGSAMSCAQRRIIVMGSQAMRNIYITSED